MASGVPGDDGIPELISMWVSPAARGKGVGDRLVESVAQWARQQGATALGLEVVEDNEKATALYRRSGFADADELAGPLPDSVHREKVMVKLLRPQTSAT